ncbi:MAG: type II toxin-antitoxin system HigB family toxin, partial [Bacteroidota bacterium]
TSWDSLNDLKQDYPSADYVGNNRVVFNIKGNDYRLIAIVIYVSQKVYMRWIGRHAEYDKVDAKNT